MTVIRDPGEGSACVERLLVHLERAGFDGAPPFLGRDAQGLEVVGWVEGPVAHTDLRPLSLDDVSAVGARAREFHDLTTDFPHRQDDVWSALARDPTTEGAVVCHNDLATWNLVRSEAGWSLIDWALAAPGRRAWDLGWTLCSLVGPDDAEADATGPVMAVSEALVAGYGVDVLHEEVLALAVERAAREAARLRRVAAEGDRHAVKLVEEGHATAWDAITARLRDAT